MLPTPTLGGLGLGYIKATKALRTIQAGLPEWLMLKLINQRLNLNCHPQPNTILARRGLVGGLSTGLARQFCTAEVVTIVLIGWRGFVTAIQKSPKTTSIRLLLTRGGTRFN